MLGADGALTGAVAIKARRELRTVRKMLASASQPCPEAWADATIPLAQVPSLPLAAA
jgi:hypothetical protein